jgi:hypothetical protein
MSAKRLSLKLAGFWVGFLVLHYAYEFFPILPFKLISGIDESFFQHAKVAFFAYLAVNAVEYLIRRREIEDLQGFVFSRLFSATILPWFVFLAWYAAAAYYGRLPTVFLEILYSNIALILAGICTLIMEGSMEGITYGRGFKAVIVALFVVSISYYILFTFRLPWADVFADPYSGGGL